MSRSTLVAAALAMALTGCGGGGDDDSDDAQPVDSPSTTAASTTTTTAAPDPYAGATAEGLLLTPADLGPGWAVGAPPSPTTCAGAPLVEDPLTYGPPDDAAQASLENAELGAVETVALHPDDATAQRALDAWRTRMASCARSGSDAGIEYVIRMEPASLGPYGDDSWASHLTIEAAGQTFAGYEVVHRQGRALVHFNVVGAATSLSDPRAEELMALVVARL